MIRSQKEESSPRLINVLCKRCGKVTPHILEERTEDCDNRTTRVGRREVPQKEKRETHQIGICLFCKNERLLGVRLE